jgi:hypothetical protein
VTEDQTAADQPTIVYDRSDRLLSGSTAAIRGVGIPAEVGEGGPTETRSAVALTLQVDASQCQVGDDGTVTMTLLVGPAEALGLSRWLREAAVAVHPLGPPLFDGDLSLDPPA